MTQESRTTLSDVVRRCRSTRRDGKKQHIRDRSGPRGKVSGRHRSRRVASIDVAVHLADFRYAKITAPHHVQLGTWRAVRRCAAAAVNGGHEVLVQNVTHAY